MCVHCGVICSVYYCEIANKGLYCVRVHTPMWCICLALLQLFLQPVHDVLSIICRIGNEEELENEEGGELIAWLDRIQQAGLITVLLFWTGW